MHHELFVNQSRLGDALYNELARQLELDEAAFETCLSDPNVADEIDLDVADASKAGIRGTPHFLIGRIENGRITQIRRVSGAQPIQAFVEAIDPLLSK